VYAAIEPTPTLVADGHFTTGGGVEVTTSIPITTQAQLDEFVLSSTPKKIAFDMTAGTVETVEEVVPSDFSTQ
jgi:hypothetical protein